jgi:phosphoserine phosphatase RsbU/P
MEPMPERDILLNALLEHSADHIYFKDTEGRFICASRSHARWFGLADAKALIGRTDRDFFSIEHARQAAEDESTVMRTGQPIEGIIEKETWPNGKVTWVSTSKLPLFDGAGKLIGIQGISRDVTAQHLANQKLEHLARCLNEQNNAYVKDMKLAAEVFELFGSALPEFLPPGSKPETAPVRCACYYLPTGALGGDFYLVLPQPNNAMRIFVCDVMGHGMQAALVAMLIRTWVQQLSPSNSDLTQLMKQLNHRLVESFMANGMAFMATAVAIDMDFVTGDLQMVSAGHPSPLIYNCEEKTVNQLIALNETGPGLGLFPASDYQSKNTAWSIGDKVMMYTDGLIECRDDERDEYQEGRLMNQFAASGDEPLAVLVNAVIEAARRHSSNQVFEDDVCMIVFERKNPTCAIST